MYETIFLHRRKNVSSVTTKMGKISVILAAVKSVEVKFNTPLMTLMGSRAKKAKVNKAKVMVMMKIRKVRVRLNTVTRTTEIFLIMQQMRLHS